MALEKEDIMALIAILQKGLVEEDEDASETPPATNSKRRSSTKKKTTTKSKSKNLFDSMSERNLHKKDSTIDKKLWGNNAPTERSRSYSELSVRCRICGKEEKVSSALVDSPDRYRCNRCSCGSAG